ncbi:helix-turn-helix domain-containing protein [Aquabacterium fontiphilum]|jgi:CRP-like cAMP-binding protein|uniref:Crp/Fnr family transcriptional regulator n=1 Tax=Aquabacterium fontiphilum TaxID=450365 RepID=UPI00137675E0|nr:Crp/Fnr family transcriptional regulator [Aquabacterium fontiphilum]NBD21375.1 helix-turn-helix domain-containing protein [Aquabacterium fontiphilum]
MPFTLERMAARLRENPVFSGLDPYVMAHLLRQSRILTLSRGQTVFEAGAHCEGLHVVLDGMVKVYASDGSGHEKVIDIVGRGQNLPGTQLTGSAHHAHHARTLSPSVVLLVPRSVLRTTLSTDVGLAQRLLDDVTSHLRRMMCEIESTTLRTARQRVCGFLLRQPALAACQPACGDDDEAIVVALPVSKGTVASFLSITPEHFSRILRELQDTGLIEMQQRTIRILHPERLAACE